jgi:N-acetylmuramoyl-L-alanine amidase/beta-lactamase regulating signal transducer with metallopeptidase domain
VLEREKMHRFNRFYLLFSLVISLIIPFLSFKIIEIIPIYENLEPIIVNPIQTSSFNENAIQESVLPLQERINYTPYIFWSLYGLITFVLIARFVKNCFALISRSKNNPIVKYKKANLVLVNEKILPHTFLNFIFINFEDYNNRNIEDELYTHELVHVSQKHTLDILFVEVIKSIFWFNPLFIFYKKAIQLNHEFLADEEIVKTYNNVPFYQSLLLRKSNGNQRIYLASNLNYLVTKKRLIMMTKSTSQKIAALKKTAIVPILAGLIYFFCIEIVAQEKIVNVKTKTKKTETKNSEITNKDKIRDSYYSGVYIKLIDERSNRKEVTLYENLSLEDRRKYLDFVPEMIIQKEIPKPLFEKMKTKNMAVWINGKVKTKEEIKKYKRTDFSYYTYSFVHKNARSKRFPQEYQYILYTKDYFDENLKNSHIHFTSDTIKIGIVKWKKENETKVMKILGEKSDSLISFPTDKKDEYNLYVKEYNSKRIIVIDAGHGGHDHGAKIDNELESKIVESIAKKIKQLNKNNDIEIVLLREDDSFIALKERVNKVNAINPHLLISLHINTSQNSNVNGVDAFVASGNEFYEKSVEAANKLIDKISNKNLAKGNVKDAKLFIIENSKCPAINLSIGYLTNDIDREYITSENGKNEIANRILEFLKQY